jgi:hypothetical protein
MSDIYNDGQPTWYFKDGYSNDEWVKLFYYGGSNDYVVLMSMDEYLIEDVPKLIEALQMAYDHHMKNKETE